MKIIKKVQGQYVELELEKTKDYPNFSEYQVYKYKNGERIPLYKQCYTDFEIKELRRNGYKIEEEVFE